MEWDIKTVVEIIMSIIMVISVVSVIYRSVQGKDAKTGKPMGIGARTIQFTCITLIIPTVIILSLEERLSNDTVGTIIGGLIGYVLSGVGNYDSNERKNKNKSEKPPMV